EEAAIRPLRGAGLHGELVTTLGVAVFLDGVAVIIWGNQPLAVPFFGSEQALTVFSGRVLPAELILIVVGVAVAIGAEAFSHWTTFGLTSLATAEDWVAAMLRGINVRALSVGSFAAAGALAMAAGPFVAPKTFASFDLGDALAIKGFVALAIGGFGSQKGALIGGIVTGLVEAVTARYLGVTFQELAIFGLLLVVLMIRPVGLFGEHEQRRI
ncbi:MAG TPA: branched-chain amino acid ABC transporter permease, partial [Chloroflexota bacterium]|nr:branched-chain amino acid ABC transporter permease [Chloroflexota bacterium]